MTDQLCKLGSESLLLLLVTLLLRTASQGDGNVFEMLSLKQATDPLAKALSVYWYGHVLNKTG